MPVFTSCYFSEVKIKQTTDYVLEKKLVVCASEGKATRVYPMPKAKDLHARLKECLKEFYEKYSSILGKEESVKMVQSMNRVTDKLGY